MTYMRAGLQAQIWAAWGQGLSMAKIARMLPTRRISVYNVIGAQGGIEPPPRRPRAARRPGPSAVWNTSKAGR
jgi:hypothetical protein